MAAKRYFRALGPALLLAVGGAYALASANWCRAPESSSPTPGTVFIAQGELLAGSARAELKPKLPTVTAGYPPPRAEASAPSHPMYARATVLAMGSVRLAVVSVELLTLPESIAAQVRARTADLKLNALWLTATHTHSGMGGYDARLLSELAGTGSHRDEAERAVVDAATSALQTAAASLSAAKLEMVETSAQELVEPRSEGARPDGKLLHVRFVRPTGESAGEWVFFAAHPTNVTRGSGVLDGDFPGFISRTLEERGAPAALYLQLAVGNVGAGVADGSGLDRAEDFAKRVVKALDAAKLAPIEAPRLAFASATVPLPRTDASRLVPRLFQRAGANFLCQSAPSEAAISVLGVGPLRLLGVPGEATVGAAKRLSQAASNATVVSLVNGYVGYIETADVVAKNQGEAKRQYFDATLLDRLTSGAEAIGPLVSSPP